MSTCRLAVPTAAPSYCEPATSRSASPIALAAALQNPRQPGKITRTFRDLLRQRLFVDLGYTDRNDAAEERPEAQAASGPFSPRQSRPGVPTDAVAFGNQLMVEFLCKSAERLRHHPSILEVEDRTRRHTPEQ